ncbi:RNA polymerase sigma factor [Chloroflexus aggregans]|uniref:RNA polymerase, sigma-24 subunit, ECF subfamily n=1 Tax=Chloroflexus aggregans (strain MD-66 / DSM 9485) TaxID=326427 RepID=B8GB80_CHLAD|nr:sigma-70 family RNA polymerase sigma factor [Chloroflexus aggregans]ACL26680.1 RNA polymerase, sigma-24 subunit, ECF subfamily [Chloroflexus aggregans DSM 9485]
MSDPQCDEVDLVNRACAGDQSACALIVQRYTGVLYNQAYRMLGDAFEAEDAVQEIFLRAFRNLKSYDPSRRLVTWLLAIGSNYCIDRLRRRRFHWLTLDDVAFWLPSTQPGPERSALQQSSREMIQRALQRLPAMYRSVIVLRYWHDLSYEEIGTILGLTEATVKTRLHRARKMLQEALAMEEEL